MHAARAPRESSRHDQKLYSMTIVMTPSRMARKDPRAGVLVAAALFGIDHAYQGAAGVVRTTLLGVGMGFLFFFSGSLLWPIALHVLIDLQGGSISRLVLGDET